MVKSSYIEELTKRLADAELQLKREGTAVVVFRLSKEWYALSADIVEEIMTTRKIHTIPHRSNQKLLGVVNFQGSLQLCVSLHNYLHVTNSPEDKTESCPAIAFPRMMAIRKGNDRWIFPVEEVYGIHRCDLSISPKNSEGSSTVNATTSFIRSVISWETRSVKFLDVDLLFKEFRSSIL